jgi:hypothetical protein
MARLTLSTVGIKSPLDVGELQPAAPPGARADVAPVPAPARAAGRPARQPRRRKPTADAKASAQRGGQAMPFYGSGSRVQTSVSLDADYAQLLEELACAASVTLNALAVAALQAGLPQHSDAARAAIVEERVRRVGVTRVERNLRLPMQLRARIDELAAAARVAAAREGTPRSNRADLVNAALSAGLPRDAQGAAELVAEYSRRLERPAA